MKGRGNSHAITTSGAMRLDLNELINTKFLIKGKELNFIFSWNTGAKISSKSVYNDTEIYIQLQYNVTDNETKQVKNFDYKIYIERVKSNLGKGFNLYFICPQSGNRCKILYLCYGAEVFKCRKAYNNRIYYNAQTHSKEYRLNGRYFNIDRTINKLNEKRETKTYKGKPTKNYLRLLKLLNKRAEVDKLRYAQLDKWLYKFIGA